MKSCIIIFITVLAIVKADVTSSNEEEEEDRIIGGSNAPLGAFPHQVSLRRYGAHFCGGSIISAQWILTAGHCTYRKSASSIRAVVGTNYLDSGGVNYGVSKIIQHIDYDPSNLSNDISLLEISGSISFTPEIQPIGLSSTDIPSDTQLAVSGWGSTSYPSGTLSNSLLFVLLKSIDMNQCISSLMGYPIYNRHICTTSIAGLGTCEGDSGGPLVTIDRMTQVGIVSWGIPCAKGRPDVFTSVAAFRTWIKEMSGV